MKNLDDLVKYVYKRYPYPKTWYSKVHYSKRCTEIYASEQAILKCMDAPTREPRDVIYDYIIVMEFCTRDIDSPLVMQRFNWIIDTLNVLYDYLS